MSWLLGFVGNRISFDQRSRLAAIHSEPLFQVQTPTFYVAAGGITDTCLFGSSSESGQDNASGWIVVGCGIELHEGYCNILTADQLGRVLSRPNPPLHHLDGHYIAIQWQRGKVVCYSDKFGLRTLYMAEANDGVAFSTRIDWMSKIKKSGEIDFEQFGAHWLTFNQFSYGSLVKGITRLEPNGVAVCTSESITTKSQPWSPDFSSRSHTPMTSIIQSFLNPKTQKHCTLSFGLSGGLDSRALLALLISDQQRPFVCHLFGHLDEPDVRIARRIASDEGLQQEFYSDPIPSQYQPIDMLRQYVTQSTLVAPSSTMLKLRYYPKIHA